MLEAVASNYAEAASMASQEGAADWYYRAKVYKTSKAGKAGAAKK